MKKLFGFLKTWFRDFLEIAVYELKAIAHDGGVLIIFTIGALGYPVLYNYVYRNGVLEDTPVAVVDLSASASSRRFLREVDATRELEVAYTCMNMEEAQRLMQQRRVNGIIYFPADFEEKIVRGETATLSIYADMSAFLYYKNLLMGTNFVMLHEIEMLSPQDKAFVYEENNPYNRAFSYSIFFLSAALLLIIQQTMFYGMSMLAGTMREQNRSFASLPDRLSGRGVGRVVMGRGAAYWLLYMGIGIYIAMIIPAVFGLPQRGAFRDILVLLLFYVTVCVFFCHTWSTFIHRREIVFVLLLFMSPVAMFLTGFSWPETAFPAFWRYFSYIFPSTFACRAFIDLNTAGGDLLTVKSQIGALTLQGIIYCLLSHVAVYMENVYIHRKNA